MLPAKIKTVKEVKQFFRHLLNSGLNFHPDDSFKDYVNTVTGKPTYTATQAKKLDGLMNQGFRVCEKEGEDIYQLAMNVFNGYRVENGLPQLGQDDKVSGSKPEIKKQFKYKDLTGSGITNKFNYTNLLQSFADEVSDNDETIEDWADAAEPGDKWSNAETLITCVK